MGQIQNALNVGITGTAVLLSGHPKIKYDKQKYFDTKQLENRQDLVRDAMKNQGAIAKKADDGSTEAFENKIATHDAAVHMQNAYAENLRQYAEKYPEEVDAYKQSINETARAERAEENLRDAAEGMLERSVEQTKPAKDRALDLEMAEHDIDADPEAIASAYDEAISKESDKRAAIMDKYPLFKDVFAEKASDHLMQATQSRQAQAQRIQDLQEMVKNAQNESNVNKENLQRLQKYTNKLEGKSFENVIPQLGLSNKQTKELMHKYGKIGGGQK